MVFWECHQGKPEIILAAMPLFRIANEMMAQLCRALKSAGGHVK